MTAPAGRHRAATSSEVGVVGLVPVLVARTVLGVIGTLLLLSVAPMLAGWSTELVISGSMMPRVAPGDLVVTEPVDAAAVAVGQIVLVSNPARPGTLLMHRVVGRDADGALRTRGDANNVDDSTPVPTEMVRGLPRVRIPYLGLPTLWLRHGQYNLLAVTCLALVGATSISIRRTGPEPRPGSRLEVAAQLEPEHR